MRFTISLLFLLSLSVCVVPVAHAAPVAASGSAIAAIVNDEAITSYDLNARVDFVLATTKISSSAESVARIKPQILRALIDERLQLQEARKQGMTLGEKELDQAIAAIESQREMAPGTIENMLARDRIPKETFVNQMQAQILWGKLLQRKVRSRIKVTDEEIAQAMRKLSAPSVKQEFHIALLQLPVDKPSRDAEVRKIAEKIVLEVRSGANFEEISRQFAGGAARESGKLPSFWVQPDELDPIIAKALAGAKTGDITAPLRNAVGYTLIKVYETRNLANQPATGTEITFKEISLKLRSTAEQKEVDALKDIAAQIEKNPGACEDNSVATLRDAEIASIHVEKTTAMLADLPAALRVIADGMKVGDVSTPLASDDGVRLYMLCGKRDGVTSSINPERARAVVFQQHMELEAQKYMRNLRRDAFIEVRDVP